MILSPFDIKGKGRIKIKTRFFFSCIKKSSVDLICNEVTMLPLSSRWIFKHIFQWITWLYDLSYHQGLILTSIIQPSGFTYVTQVSNQVGLHILTQLSNQVGLQIWRSPYMTEYKNLHHRSQHNLFIKLQIWLFITNTKRPQERDHISEPS